MVCDDTPPKQIIKLYIMENLGTPALSPNKFNLKTFDELFDFAGFSQEDINDGITYDTFIDKARELIEQSENSYYHVVLINPICKEGKVDSMIDEAIKLLECAKIWAENFGF